MMIDLILLTYCLNQSINQTALANATGFWDLMNYLNAGNSCMPSGVFGLSVYSIILFALIFSLAFRYEITAALLAGSFFGIILGLGFVVIGLLSWNIFLLLFAIHVIVILLALSRGAMGF